MRFVLNFSCNATHVSLLDPTPDKSLERQLDSSVITPVDLPSYLKMRKFQREIFAYIRLLTVIPHIASFLVIGAGVIGLSTALELRTRYPGSDIVIAAKYLPGDSAPDYTSAWGGANWFPAARVNGTQEDWEAIGYRKLKELASTRPESGVQPMNIRWHYERPIDKVGIKTPETGKLWFEELVGGPDQD
jgi:hypothetical protein